MAESIELGDLAMTAAVPSRLSQSGGRRSVHESSNRSEGLVAEDSANNVGEVRVSIERVSRVESQSGGVSLPPVDTGLHAWLFCFSACMLETFIFGWNNTYGVFQDYYSSHPPFNTAPAVAISVVGIISLALQYIEIIIVISFCQRFPLYTKPAMWLALLLCVLTLVVASFSTQVWQLILFQGILFGVAAGVLYAPIVMWLSEWFVARRGLAGGIIFGGSGVGGFIFPLALGAALDRFGFRWTLRIWALVLGVCCSIALLGSNPRVPPRLQITDRPRVSSPVFSMSFLKDPLLLCVLGTTVTTSLAFFPVSIFISTYTSSVSSSSVSQTVALSLFNAASVICYIIFGRISDSYPYPLVVLFSGAGSALAAFLLWGFARDLGMVFAFAIVFGGLSGGFPGIWAAAATEIAGPAGKNERTSLALGAISVVKGIAAIIGPIVAAALRDNSFHKPKQYGNFGFGRVEIFVGSMSAVSAAGALILVLVSPSMKRVKPS